MSTMVKGCAPDVDIEVLIEGSGPDVVLLPSAERGAEDFKALQAALTAAGFRSIAVNFRGAGASSKPKAGLTFAEVADDVASVIRQLCAGPAHIMGHALGSTVARATSSRHPDLIKTVSVAPAGGHNFKAYPLRPEVFESFKRCHDTSLPGAERVKDIQTAFFAPGADAGVWLDGWHQDAKAISEAMMQSDPEDWWRGGTAPILVMHSLQDAMLPPHAGREFAQAIGPRATYFDLPHCGHAVLPEQPALVAEHLIGFLRAHP